MLCAGFGLLWLLTGGFLYYQAKVVNKIVSSDKVEEMQADYENTYRKYAGLAQPRIVDVVYNIDIFPEERNFQTKAKLSIVNKHTHGMDSIHMSIPVDFKMIVDFPAAELVWRDALLNYQIYQFEEPLAQYTSLMIMEEAYGRDKMKQFLKYEMDRYLSGRGSECQGEQSLMYNESQPYIHYRKGSVVMYALREYIG